MASWVIADTPSGPVSLAAGQLMLGPGTDLTLGATLGPVLLAVEAGTLGVSAGEDQRVGPGEGVSLATSTTVELSISATVPVGLLVFMLIPDQS